MFLRQRCHQRYAQYRHIFASMILIITIGYASACSPTSSPMIPTAIPLATAHVIGSSAETPVVSVSHAPVPTLVMPTMIAEKPQPPQEWAHRWLRGEPCWSPCWEGITPGRTSAYDAIDLLNRNSLVANLKLSRRMNALSDDIVKWDLVDDVSQSGAGSISYPQRQLPQIVSRIGIVFSSGFQFNEIIAAYGEPSHVIPQMGTFSDPHSPKTAQVYNLVLVYLSRGFFIETDNIPMKKPNISSNTSLQRKVVFFVPTAEGLSNVSNVMSDGWDSTDLVPWKGFHDFDWYCQQAKDTPHHVCK